MRGSAQTLTHTLIAQKQLAYKHIRTHTHTHMHACTTHTNAHAGTE